MIKCITITCLLLALSAYADTWQIEEVASLTGGYLSSPSIVTESGDNIHIAYRQTTTNTSELKYAFRTGSSWSITSIDSNSTSYKLASSLSMALNASGNPCIAYSDNTSEGLLKYAVWSGTSWMSELIDNIGPEYWGTSLCLDPVTDQQVLAFSTGNPSTDCDLMFASYDDPWVVSPVDTVGKMGVDLCMKLTPDGIPHISYFDFTNLNLKYTFFDDNIWHTVTLDSSAAAGMYNSIALDSNGNPHISYHDFYYGDLKYTHYTGTEWITEIVDAAGNVGSYNTSIVVDSNDRPHIAYYHQTHDCLMYAVYNGSEWEKKVIDEGLHAGRTASLTLDSNDLPHIAYSAKETGISFLRHAYLTPQGVEENCEPETVSLSIFPNPSSGSAVVSFEMPVSDHITLSLYDITGRKIATIADETLREATYNLTVNNLTPGVYLCSLQAGEFSAMEKLVVIE